ncbi:MAG: NADPH-dependent 7-cyano-7-deazaguanine reductase QueF [Bacteroidales bacterium]|nr:NADPH-dependent 7-cyano-7-deazaguanine reductase QueF [Bacteroidales bacterium]MCF8457297.1 NADPH-dependent 7-cyano-7-deazaguanine reductase QueF [Bacteroidales bacterium]
MESKYLGKKTKYPDSYQPNVLLPLPRFDNRREYDMPEHPAFFGADVWHAYEFGFLTNKGLPVTGILKIVYPSSNLFIVESKSLKLYLNSFNMARFGDTRTEGLKIVLELIKVDLEKVLQTKVEVNYFEVEGSPVSDFDHYKRLEDLVDIDGLFFYQYSENKHILAIESHDAQEIRVFSDVLRSNCKVTHQPDWGSVFIHLKSSKKLDMGSLLQYLVSFRNENHFHEEVCEIIFKRLFDLLQPEELMVACIYTRRGGIDICPVRANKVDLLPKFLINPGVMDKKLLRQ